MVLEAPMTFSTNPIFYRYCICIKTFAFVSNTYQLHSYLYQLTLAFVLVLVFATFALGRLRVVPGVVGGGGMYIVYNTCIHVYNTYIE